MAEESVPSSGTYKKRITNREKNMKTLVQKRAEYALGKVLSYLKNLNTNEKKEFKSFVSGLPAMILQNGFGLTMAFLLSKQTKQKEAFDQIKEWLIRYSDLTKPIFQNLEKKEDNTEFLKYINKIEQKEYRMVQQEALSLLEWIKRYAAAFVLDEEEGNDATSS